MTNSSIICNFIAKNPGDWRDQLTGMGIKIKDDTELGSSYCIFNYGIGVDFTNPIVQEARGIIIDTDTLDVVCFPFRKFGKYTESYADDIDWKTATVHEKIDGSLIKLWYDNRKKKWRFSTNSMIDAGEAYYDIENGRTFLDLIINSNNYKYLYGHMDEDRLPYEYTYLFELTSEKHQIVVKHYFTTMYHIGTRNNITGEEVNIEIPAIHKPNIYNHIYNLEQCIYKANNEFNISCDKITSCSFEGFVVVDKNWNRIKVKSDIYSILHNIVNNGEVSKKKLIKLIDDNRINITSIAEQFPDKAHWFYYYAYKYNEVKYQMNSFVNIIRKVYSENGGDRKDIALRIRGHRYAPIAFNTLDNDNTIEEILSSFSIGYIDALCKYIPNYNPENYSYLFKNIEENN